VIDIKEGKRSGHVRDDSVGTDMPALSSVIPSSQEAASLLPWQLKSAKGKDMPSPDRKTALLSFPGKSLRIARG
jgi:hypothetical protein